MNEFYFMVKNDINLLTLYSERITFSVELKIGDYNIWTKFWKKKH